MPFAQQKADRATDFIECLKLTGDFYGQPFQLVPWQKKLVADVYGTYNARGIRQYKSVYLEVPKKNAKSQLLSGIALLHLFNPAEPHGAIYGCAGDREQAAIIFDMAVEMIEQEPELEDLVRITGGIGKTSKKRIQNKSTGTFYEVISAEHFTKHGKSPTLVLFDELHVQPNRMLYDVMTHGAGLSRKEPMWWVITTAGLDPDRTSIGWEVHEIASEIIKARETGDKAKDLPTWYPVIYGYQGEDIYNEKNWYAANPSLGTTIDIDAFREIADKAKISPADELNFRWLNLNQWMTTKLSSWLPLELWDQTIGAEWTRKDLIPEKTKLDCFVGMDLSTTTDLSALCVIFPPQPGLEKWRVIWDAFIPADNMQARIREDKVPYDQWAAEGWIYPTPGNVIDYTRIEARLIEYQKMYNVKELSSDPAFATMLLQRMKDEYGMEVTEAPQGYKYETDPMNMIETLMKNGTMEHENNPVARWNWGNTSIHKNGNAQIKYVKEHRGRSVTRTKRIDLTAAMVAAMMRAKFYDTNQSVYNNRGLLTL